MEPLPNLGLWGDLDELDAVESAFRAIGVDPLFDDASKWKTVGDLWAFVRRAAPEVADSTDAWDKFRQAISAETCVDWIRVSEQTALLDGRGGHPFTRLATTIRERMSKRG